MLAGSNLCLELCVLSFLEEAKFESETSNQNKQYQTQLQIIFITIIIFYYKTSQFPTLKPAYGHCVHKTR
jgi:hypothetical protein